MGAGAREGEGRVQRDASFDGGTRLVESTKPRERRGPNKIRMRKISVGLDRSSTPLDRLLVTAEVVLRHARLRHPDVGQRVARTEAQRLGDVSVSLFGATDINFTHSDQRMGGGKISIEPQRVLTFGDALCRALRQYVDKS